MLKDKHILYEYVIRKTRPMVLRNQYQDYVKQVRNNFNIPENYVTDIITTQMEESAATSSDEILYALVVELQKEITDKDFNIGDYFTNVEIKRYSKWKFKEKKLEFPLVIDCISVAEDMWVGSADVDWFMLLRDANIIRYNPEIQRTMKKVTKNGHTSYEITKNRKAINGIIKLFDTNEYIPNMICLNISDDSECSFYYDEEEKQLIIKSVEHLDILDGYHRYYGMCREKDLNPEFNTNFVLQITNFSTYKGKQYIHLQDLKTKMSVIDSASMNMSAPENQVCERLNVSPLCDWRGQIQRNGGQIDLPELASIIWRLYFEGINNVTQKDIAQITKDIEGKINIIVNQYPEYIEKELNFVELSVIMIYVRYYMNEPQEIRKYLSYIKETVDELNKPEYKHYWAKKSSSHPLTPKTIKFVQSVIEGK